MNQVVRNYVGAAGLMLAAGGVAAGNLSVSREVTVDRSPATVWKLLGEFNSLDVWLPPVLGSTFEGDATKPGAVRVLDLGNDAKVTEQLVAYSSAERSYSYAFLDSPLPVKDYVATIELRAVANGKTLIRWHSTFDSAGAPDAAAREAVQGIYDAGLAKLASIFGK